MLVSTSHTLLLILLLAVVQWTTIVVADAEEEGAYRLVISPPDASSQGNFSVVLPSNATKLRGTYHDCELRNLTRLGEESPLRTFAGFQALQRLHRMWASLSARGNNRPLLETPIYPMWKGSSRRYQSFLSIVSPILHRILQDNVLLPKEAAALVEPLSKALLEQGASLEKCISDAKQAAYTAGATGPQKAEAALRSSAETCFQGLVSKVGASVLSGINANGTMEHPEVTLPFFQLWVVDYVMLSLAELNQQMFSHGAYCDEAAPDDLCKEKLRAARIGVQSFAASLRRHTTAVERALETMKKFDEDAWKQATTIASHPVERRTESCVHVQSNILGNATICKLDEGSSGRSEGKQLSCGTDFSKQQHCKVAVSDHSVESEAAADLCLAVLGGIAYYHDEAARLTVAKVYERDMAPLADGLNATATLMEDLASTLKEKLDGMVGNPSEPLQ